MQVLRHDNYQINKEIYAHLDHEIYAIYDQFWEHYIEHSTLRALNAISQTNF